MLEALLKLLDYGIKLLEQRDRYDEKVFDRIVTPTFQLGEKVFQDYLELFRDLRRKVSVGAAVEDLIRFLEEGRVRYLPVRVRLRAILGRPDLWQRQDERKLVDGLFGLLCGALSTYEERQLERPGRYIVTRHTLLDLLYRIDELRRDDGGREVEWTLTRMVDLQQEAITAAWKDAAEAYASIQEAIATTGKLKLGRRSPREQLRNLGVPEKGPISPQSPIVRIRELLTLIRGMIPNAVYSRRLGTKLEWLVAEAAPECVQRAREIKETLHDLDHGEPNVTVTQLEQGLASLENELGKLGEPPNQGMDPTAQRPGGG